MIIYKVTNQINGKVYIGQATSLKRRWSRHKSVAKNNGKKYALHLAMQKYGIDNFKIEEIDGANSQEELNYKEIHYIHKFNTLSPNGYNLMLSSNFKRTPETIARMTEANRRNVNLEKLRNQAKLAAQTNSKPVVAISIETGTKLYFDAVKDVETLGVNCRSVRSMLNGVDCYRAVNGYFFEYVNLPTIKKTKKGWKRDARGRILPKSP